jgi:hypothetical protein
MNSHELNLIVDTTGAENVSDDGSTIEIEIASGGLGIPHFAKNIKVSLVRAAITYNYPNVFSSGPKKNNTFRFDARRNNGIVNSYDIEIEEGLYDFTEFSIAIVDKIVEAGGPINLLQFEGNEPEEKVIIKPDFIEYNQFTFYFDDMDCICKLIGFTGTIVATDNVKGTLRPAFNTIKHYVISSNLVQNGITINGRTQPVLDFIGITVANNKEELFSPAFLRSIACPHLAGNSNNRWSFSLLDNSLNRVSTRGETFSLLVMIKWDTYPSIATNSTPRNH